MTKAELVENAAKVAGLTKTAADKAIATLTGAGTTALNKGEKFTMIDFGTFGVGECAVCTGENIGRLAPS
jgi:DNA-binding protein HU-beta